MKKSVRAAIAFTIILAGTGLAMYPLISNYLYEKNQGSAISAYDEQTKEISDTEKEQELEKARLYNASLLDSNVILTDPFTPDALSKKDSSLLYEELLNIGDDGVMGYLEIPAIDLSLNIYHGTDSRALEAGVGHLENTSLPVGGESTHAVLSAHTGLPGKKLFTDLELLETGDVFLVHVLDEVLAYEVDQIKVVNPENVSDLGILRGEDYTTLITCTPYGVNSHRLLVRGIRVPYEEIEEESHSIQKKTGSQWMRQYFRGIFTGLAVLLLILIIYWIYRAGRNKNERRN